MNSKLWIKKIEPEILQAANLPASMLEPSFPLEAFGEGLGKALGIKDLTLEVGASEWKTDKSYFSGLGSLPVVISFQVSPLRGDLFWIMAQEDVKKLTGFLKDEKGGKLIVENAELVKGLYRYILLRAFDTVQSIGTYGQLGFKLSQQTSFEKSSFAIDVSLQSEGEVLWGRLLIPSTFQQSFASHFTTQSTTLSTLERAKDIQLPLRVIAGTVSLSQQEINSLQEGDFIQIDNLYYHPNTKRGSYKVFMENTPIFQAKVKDDNLKILDYIYAFTENHHG